MFCTNCGHKFSNTDIAFCTQCGSKVSSVKSVDKSAMKSNVFYSEKEKGHAASTVKSKDNEQSKKDNVYLFVGIATVLIAFVFIVFIVVEFNRDTAGNDDAIIADADIGDIIWFGNINWRVLDAHEDRILVISDRVLEHRDFHDWAEEATWADSYIRFYLNDEFLERFSLRERARIATVNNVTPDNPSFYSDGGVNTHDKVFLLSLDEVVRYFGDSGQLVNIPSGLTEQGGAQSVNIDDEFNSARVARDVDFQQSSWWLRSPGHTSFNIQGSFAVVNPHGTVSLWGSRVGTHRKEGVRPAMWLYRTRDSGERESNLPTNIFNERFDGRVRQSFAEMNMTNEQLADLVSSGEISSNVTHLDLRMNEQISDLTPLAGLTNLMELHLDRNTQISDLTPLSGLAYMEVLGLGGNLISDITPLSGLTNLTALGLTGDRISDLTPLIGLRNLTMLYLNSNQINDLHPLANLTSLSHLDVVGNQISDLTPLSGLRNLTVLEIFGDNPISDLTPLANLTNLTRLLMFNNRISDLTPLANLSNLTQLGLEGNYISDLSPLAGLRNLSWVNLRFNYITEWSPIAHVSSVLWDPQK